MPPLRFAKYSKRCIILSGISIDKECAMKLFFQILFHIIYCTFLPLAVILFAVMTLPLCFPEGYAAKDILIHFAIGCLPSWGFVLLGWYRWKKGAINTRFARRLINGHSITVAIIGILGLIFASMSKVDYWNIALVLGITLCCLLPRIVMEIVFRMQKR